MPTQRQLPQKFQSYLGAQIGHCLGLLYIDRLEPIILDLEGVILDSERFERSLLTVAEGCNLLPFL